MLCWGLLGNKHYHRVIIIFNYSEEFVQGKQQSNAQSKPIRSNSYIPTEIIHRYNDSKAEPLGGDTETADTKTM